MGNCLCPNSEKGAAGSRKRLHENATNKADKPKSSSTDKQVVALPTSQTTQAVNNKDGVIKDLLFTKGSSMALPENTDGLMKERDALPRDVAEIAEFLQETELTMEENFENPFYMKIDRNYKVGNAVNYPPEMTGNISFSLKPAPEGDGEDFSGGTQVTFAYKSLQGQSDSRGLSAPDKPNQDSVAVVRNRSNPHRAIFGIFDGHGPFGEHASHFCRMEMLKMYTIALRQHPNDSPQMLLGHMLRYLDRKFSSTDHRTVPVDPIVSGTTAIVIMLDGDDIIAANVGDSRAILATRENENNIVIVPLSDDHKPDRPDERNRIERTDAILMNENDVRNRKNPGAKSPEAANPGGPVPKTYICRHTNGEIVYGVLFTRSIGDVDAHKNLGVISDPEFRRAKVSDGVDTENEQVIIIGSDGIWDMMTNEECATVALTSMDPYTACQEIVKTCADRWAKSGEGRRDDITVCVVGLGVKFGWSKDGTREERAGSYYGLL